MADYPAKSLAFHQFFAGSFADLYPKPGGDLHDWPPIQVTYLDNYLAALSCQTIIEETHYVDRDYIEDLALFYGKSLRNYPNFCRRFHFFKAPIDVMRWRALLERTRTDIDGAEAELAENYLGFTVVRPLPGHPVGRTVLSTLGIVARDGTRDFAPIRTYAAHLGGFRLKVFGLAFQQQDQGVSACATTAVWTALQSAAHTESLRLPAPADITQAASRYLMMNGRTLPSEGLAIQQICEAIRDSGLAPVLVRATSFAVDRGVLDTFLRSGFPAVLAIKPESTTAGDAGHAICAVGAKVGDVQPQTNPALEYQDGSTALKAVYVHDDRLGPYAVARLNALTVKTALEPQTNLIIKWPLTAIDEESAILHSMIISMPVKVRLPVTRLRRLGHIVAQALGQALPEFKRSVTVTCRYVRAIDYCRRTLQSDITRSGVEQLTTQVALSRYLGLIETIGLHRPLVDVLLDCTEAVESPSVIAVVLRTNLSTATTATIKNLATSLGVSLIM